MHCCARNIERLTRIPKLRTDLQSRFLSSCPPIGVFDQSGVLLGSMGVDIHWTSKETPTSSRRASFCSFAPPQRQVSNEDFGNLPEPSATSKGTYRNPDFTGSSRLTRGSPGIPRTRAQEFPLDLCDNSNKTVILSGAPHRFIA